MARNESVFGAIDGSTFAGRVSFVTVIDSLIEENQGGGLYFGANGTLIAVPFSSQCGTGKPFSRRKAGLNRRD